MKPRFIFCLLFLAGFPAGICRADTFGTGANSFEIEFVTIGNPGNPADTTGNPRPAGSVPYEYRIGKYEIPEDAVRKANAQSALNGAPLDITLDSRGPDKPATSITWFEAARFVNWLNTSTGSPPAYKFVPVTRFSPAEIVASQGFVLWEPGDMGYDPDNLFRNRLARYFLPSADEWYKAAFYDPVAETYWDYPTGSDTPPLPVASGTVPGTAVYLQDLAIGPADVMRAGGLSSFGTMAQGGNVDEWEETTLDLTNSSSSELRGRRGGFWEFSSFSSSDRFSWEPTNAIFVTGFRVARIVPEPTTAVSISLVISLLSALRIRLAFSMRNNRAYEIL